jgi:hypothetical protein
MNKVCFTCKYTIKMKRYLNLTFILVLCCGTRINAQTATQNYIVATVPYKAVTKAAALDDTNSNTAIQYFNGIGQLVQTVQKAFAMTTSGLKDVVNVIEYDTVGREVAHWLPIPTNTNAGDFVTSADVTSLWHTRYGSTEKPYATTEYEASPLSRVIGQYEAGADWYSLGKDKQIRYTPNGNNDVKLFTINGNQLVCSGYYTAATLYGQTTIDEDGHTTEEFTDMQGRKILIRKAGNHDTYYVYDDLNNLRYVLPPLASDALTTNLSGFSEGSGSVLNLYGYIYHYDGRKRCVEKKLPGADWIYMVFDNANRMILSQDGNQRLSNKWTVNKYDVLGRLLYSGIIYNSNTRQQMADNFSGSIVVESYCGMGSYGGYTSTFSSLLTPSILLTVNYYDNYRFISYYEIFGQQLNPISQNGYDIPDTIHTKTLLTGTKIYHLDDPTKYEVTALYYDKYGRIVQTRATNHLGGYDITYNALDFTGKPTKTLKTHSINGTAPTVTELYTYTYDKAQRLLTTTHSLNGGTAVTLVSNTYDDLGRLQTKNLGGADMTTYGYNVRSWITGITGNRFSEKLYYNSNPLGSQYANYNGNISGMQWSIPSENLGYDRFYSLGYDDLNRYIYGYYGCANNGIISVLDERYYEIFEYDRMGNITEIYRNDENSWEMNYLTFQYKGNQLSSVNNDYNYTGGYGYEGFVDKVQATTEYAYDANGSMTYDANSGISTIQYNVLNLPDIIQFTEGHKNVYSYGADGKKLEVNNYTLHTAINVPQGNISTLPSNPGDYTKVTTDYVGNMIYENGTLKEILLPEGYWQSGTYYYYLKDHLGNNRVTINSSGTIVEKSHYYPSGMRFYDASTSNSAALPYRYNNKELETMNGLNQYDYGARRRGAGLPIFTTRDRFSEKFPWQSPYCHAGNNPINYVDVNGDSIWITDADKNKILYTPGTDYNGNDQFVCTTFDYLNQLFNNDYGGQVVDELSCSTNNYTYTNTYAKDGKGNEMKDALSFAGDANGGGEIHAGYLMDANGSNDSKMRSIAHETFHGYQSEFGERGRESYIEVEALLFQTAVMKGGTSYFGKNEIDPASINFQRAMFDLLYSPTFNQQVFNSATINFLNGSSQNSGGVYTRAQYQQNIKINPVINKFFPLVK